MSNGDYVPDRSLREIHQFEQARRIAPIELVKGFTAGRGHFGMFVQLRQKWQQIADTLPAKDTKIPRTEVLGRDHSRLDLPAKDLGSLPRTAQIRRVNHVHR